MPFVMQNQKVGELISEKGIVGLGCTVTTIHKRAAEPRYFQLPVMPKITRMTSGAL
jgi:hypothetical protein